jgi:hypothetical protein
LRQENKTGQRTFDPAFSRPQPLHQPFCRVARRLFFGDYFYPAQGIKMEAFVADNSLQ